jgi:hypothetical protein
MSTIEKIAQIHTLIQEIDEEAPAIGTILLEGFNLSLKTLKAVAEKGERSEVDISDHINIVCNALGIDLKDIVQQILNGMQQNDSVDSNKAPDQETLEFITSNLDDYEKFLAQNKSKESLDFLSKQL